MYFPGFILIMIWWMVGFPNRLECSVGMLYNL